jgi:hypothetical protein
MAEVEYFTSTVQAALARKQVKLTRLYFFDFVDAPTYLWQGVGVITAGGNEWTGSGKFLTMGELEQPLKGQAPSITVTLSGVDASIVAQSIDSVDKVRDRAFITYDQYYDADALNWTPLDDPVQYAAFTMKNVSFKRVGPQQRSISVACEGPFYRRGVRKYGLYTDRDQQGRFPGDRGLEFIPTLVDKTTKWPFSG